METVVVNNVNELYHQAFGHEVFIYGAKTIALKTNDYLYSQGINAVSFIVSKKYVNPNMLQGKSVLRIEEYLNKAFDCIIIAISGDAVWKVEKDLHLYNIKKIIIIHPYMADKFPSCCILSEQSQLSNNFISGNNVQIVSDESSSIIIEEGVFFEDEVVILATEHSNIQIRSGCYIKSKTLIIAENASDIIIGVQNTIAEKVKIISKENSKLFLEDKIHIGEQVRLSTCNASNMLIGSNSRISDNSLLFSLYSSRLLISENSSVFHHAHIYVSYKGTITIGKNTSFEANLFMDCHRSHIEIGNDNMFSVQTKIDTGGHHIFDITSSEELESHCAPIKTADHVWIGMGATLLPGTNIAEGSIVGASSTVNKPIPPHTICAGIPAKVIRTNIRWER